MNPSPQTAARAASRLPLDSLDLDSLEIPPARPRAAAKSDLDELPPDLDLGPRVELELGAQADRLAKVETRPEEPAPEERPRGRVSAGEQIYQDMGGRPAPNQSSNAPAKRVRPLRHFAAGDDGPSFYLSLSDLMSLLLVFFVLIFSLTQPGRPEASNQEAPAQERGVTLAHAAPEPQPRIATDPFPNPEPVPDSLIRGMEAVAMLGTADPGLADRMHPDRVAAGRSLEADALVVDRALLNLVTQSRPSPAQALPSEERTLSGLLERLRDEVDRDGLSGLEMERQPDKLILRLPEAITFDVARAEIKPAMRTVLLRLAQVLSEKQGYDIFITGHTDDVPIANHQFASNWELSAARAAAVARALTSHGFNPGQLTIQGLADQSPRVPNNNPANRQLNRRVEIELRAAEAALANRRG